MLLRVLIRGRPFPLGSPGRRMVMTGLVGADMRFAISLRKPRRLTSHSSRGAVIAMSSPPISLRTMLWAIARSFLHWRAAKLRGLGLEHLSSRWREFLPEWVAVEVSGHDGPM